MTIFETQRPNVFTDGLWGSIVWVLIVGIVAFCLWKFLAFPSWKDGRLGLLAKIVFTALSIFATYLTIQFAYSGIDYWLSINQNYQTYVKGECLTVEGQVEDFHPMPQDLHDTEHFTVCGVYFYYDDSNSKLYYSKCAKDGGVISKNGINVKIWYIANEEGASSQIMRIDVLE